MNHIVILGANGDTEHPSARFDETTFRIRCYRFTREDDTSEPIRHIPRMEVVSYYKHIQQPLPDNINDTQMGLDPHLAKNTCR